MDISDNLIRLTFTYFLSEKSHYCRCCDRH
ncbi:hypothetical protein SBA5_490062 [Candidatus Sulfotelmatomonas gaucii]|uniref:Uncharacterized protein n=1 Tax=Candidatus Sulfuritelmatomonas gaucii TaxID=2043161 RepID=A0A2N9LPY8_9BACT|nr:hypothetical protein SBA5_490062 [Candidatus Sulfotelmatomonas gaucii]